MKREPITAIEVRSQGVLVLTSPNGDLYCNSNGSVNQIIARNCTLLGPLSIGADCSFAFFNIHNTATVISHLIFMSANGVYRFEAAI